MAHKENFIDYLRSLKKTTGANKYKPSTIDAYANSIELITNDLNFHLKLKLASLFDLNNVEELKKLFGKLYSIEQIKREEDTQRKRKTNGFKRYIEFREFEQGAIIEENQPDLKDNEESRTEGGKKVIISIVSERDPRLRKSAIKIHGTTCIACKFNFKTTYGLFGEGFIEIHHVKLLSGASIPTKTNPRTDLVPLCSNCHRMIHRKKGITLSIEELKQKLK